VRREPRAKRVAFEAYLKLIRVAAFDAAAARQAFVVQRYLRQTGQQIGRTDPLMPRKPSPWARCASPTTSGTSSESPALSSRTGSGMNSQKQG